METTISQEMAKELLSIEQAPDMAQQIINYSFYSHLEGVVFFSIVLASALAVAYNTKKLADASRGYDNEGYVIFGALYSVIAGLVGAVATVINFNYLLMVTFAPKIYLIEYLSGLIK